VTVTGIAEVTNDPRFKARYLAVHPYASLYADFGDFHLWRVRPMGALFVGGFARAVRLKQADLAPDAAAVATIIGEEQGIISHCNDDHSDALAAIAGAVGDWKMVTADIDGMDLALGETVLRVHWSTPVSDSAAMARQMVRMARDAGARG
jgi:putative heme iron utilization protein